MYRIDKHRWLPSLLTLATIAALQAVFAQSPQTPALPSAQIPAQSYAPSMPSAATVPAARTPEEQGDLLMLQGRYQAAIEAYKNGPRDSAVLENKLGIAYQMMFNVAEAIRCYQASLRLDPKNSRVYNNLGTIFDSQKEYGAAEKMYRKSLKMEPQSAVVEKNLGTALMAQHKYDKGTDAYQKALAIDPGIFENSTSPRVEKQATTQDRGAMNYYMAKSCIRAGMNSRAIEYLRRAINEGFTSPRKIEADSEFAGLRGLPEFEEMMAALRSP